MHRGSVTYTVKNVSSAALDALARAAGQAGDHRQVGLCVLALEGEINFDDYTVFSRDDVRYLESVSQKRALELCVEALNNAVGRASPR